MSAKLNQQDQRPSVRFECLLTADEAATLDLMARISGIKKAAVMREALKLFDEQFRIMLTMKVTLTEAQAERLEQQAERMKYTPAEVMRTGILLFEQASWNEILYVESKEGEHNTTPVEAPILQG